MPRFQVNIYLETEENEPWAPEGPGWYIDARSDMLTNPPGLEVSGRIRITPQEAEQLGQVLDKFTVGKPINWAMTEDRRTPKSIQQAIEEANVQARADLVALLEEIERRAQNMAVLRTRLGEYE